MKVDALALDLNNFRFAVEQPDEAMAFNLLFDEEDVMSVANSLLREGYRTNEVPLVVEENRRYVVLEANRRVSALRALRDPSLVPKHQDSLRTLIRRYQTDADDLPDGIYVTVYPDRAAAAPVLARQHIGEDKKRWGLDEQAKFVLAQLAGGADLKTLRATQTGIKDVVRLVKMGRVRQALKDTAFTDTGLAEYATGADLKMSAFEYAYRDRSIRPLLGFDFDDEGDVVSRPQTPGQIAVLERLLRGFRSGELSTRKVLNHKKEQPYQDLVDELRTLADAASPTAPAPTIASTSAPYADTYSGDSPTDFVAGQPRPSSLVGGAPGLSITPETSFPTGPSSTPVGPNSPDSKRKLVLGELQLTNAPVGLEKRFFELRSIDITTHPAAAAMLLRSVVESLIKHHYTRRGDTTVAGMLSQVVPRVAKDYGSTKSLERSIRLLQNSLAPKDRPGSGSWFNAAGHDPAMVIEAQQVRDAWQELQPLVQFLLQQAPATP
ncbi:MAG: hypothetical protein ACRCYX_15140 [Dermatophilaceae bacterium]